MSIELKLVAAVLSHKRLAPGPGPVCLGQGGLLARHVLTGRAHPHTQRSSPAVQCTSLLLRAMEPSASIHTSAAPTSSSSSTRWCLSSRMARSWLISLRAASSWMAVVSKLLTRRSSIWPSAAGHRGIGDWTGRQCQRRWAAHTPNGFAHAGGLYASVLGAAGARRHMHARDLGIRS